MYSREGEATQNSAGILEREKLLRTELGIDNGITT
jgi:hypothetical protein